MNVLKFPLTRITFLFIIGILFADYFRPSLVILFIVFAVSLLMLIVNYFVNRKIIGDHILFGINVMIVSCLAGMITLSLHNQIKSPDNYIHFVDESQRQNIRLSISEVIKSSAKYDRYIADVHKLGRVNVSGKLLVSVKRDTLNSTYEIGNVLNIHSRIFKNKELAHDFQFDYGKYLNRKGIYAQTFCSNEVVENTGEVEKSLSFYASKIRTRIVNNLRDQKFNERELQVLNALILGQQQNIEADIVKDYQYAGAVHVLSVSGLHVGLIVIFLNFMFRNIYNTRLGNLFKLIFTLLALISFAILAGLSPPIVRAVTMFCFVAIGMYIRRGSNIFHTLIISMLLILLFEPNFLFDVGFQLSYLALFFIVWLQPIFKIFYTPKNKIIRYIWDIITVSFAAQIGTMPLSLYYFHQFPALFLITNIIILPALSIIMLLGIFVMILAYYDLQISFLTLFLEKSIYYVNFIIGKIASYESFVFKDISLNIWMMIALFIIITFSIFYLEYRKYRYVILLFLSIIGFQLLFLSFKIYNENREEVVFFNNKNYILIAEKRGRNVDIFTNFTDSIVGDEYNLKNYLWYNFSKIDTIHTVNNFEYLGGKRIFILDSDNNFKLEARPDIVFVTNSPKINFERFIQKQQPHFVVIDVNNFKYLQKQWKAICHKNKIPFHIMSEKGLYIID